ncbi:hypothetical protein M406DRAFT_73027 [Cryphonectria parasitica EP155]|uniref:Uncharacterized protein n=1 Tax=Cryphonectria parasitica (strain ATCC 38755 / EP155) TaxID=660469 RepID=A0A9P4XTH2_CRYP1|nr:uncharacterized protein M406DRAFT_73027 [Cryphonectria parasitica EP155]KAF3760541.1 hypothetical protein M406DRAFT_73027 [Cryphonectria parasitica EP155]
MAIHYPSPMQRSSDNAVATSHRPSASFTEALLQALTGPHSQANEDEDDVFLPSPDNNPSSQLSLGESLPNIHKVTVSVLGVRDPSPSNSKTGPSQQASTSSSQDLQLDGLGAVEKDIPENLRAKFMDLRVLYGKALGKPVSKPVRKGLTKKTPYVGSSRKNRGFLGPYECKARLYITVQFEKPAAKRARRLFAQKHVLEDMEPNFEVKVVDDGLVRLNNDLRLDGDAHLFQHHDTGSLQESFKPGLIKAFDASIMLPMEYDDEPRV